MGVNGLFLLSITHSYHLTIYIPENTLAKSWPRWNDAQGGILSGSTLFAKIKQYQPFTPLAIFRSWHHFLFLDNIERIQKKFKFSFGIILKIWKMEHLLQKSKCSIFHNIFKYMIFQRRKKALLWSRGLRERNTVIFGNYNLWPLNIYNVLSQVYCINQKKLAH